MFQYHPPTEHYSLLFKHLGMLESLQSLPQGQDMTLETLEQILEEGAKVIAGTLAPLDRSGDTQGAQHHGEDHRVSTPAGFAAAYESFVAGGWQSLSLSPSWGGQGLPMTLSSPIFEMIHGANMSWGLCLLLTLGAVETLETHGSEALKATYLEKMVSGQWTGTMNLTEAHAGSDLSQLKTRAVPREDGSYALSGQKVFITYGEHDMSENIVHLVLGRLPDAPEGSGGISLFLVPRFIPDSQGQPQERNNVRCLALERKLGIHGSPTCVMAYEEAQGWLVGEAHQGLKCMFTMMNSARLQVGLQGIGLAEKSWQQAWGYAQGRVQGQRDGQAAAIAQHPDVGRMLLEIGSTVEAMRALFLETMVYYDTVRGHASAPTREHAQRRVGLLTPVIKAFCTDEAVRASSEALQVFGGMGFIEDSGMAQTYRDARILPIYEGTNGIQALDLVLRKILADRGVAFAEYIEELHALVNHLNGMEGDAVVEARGHLAAAVDSLEGSVEWLREHAQDRNLIEAAAVPFTGLFGVVACGVLAVRTLLAVSGEDEAMARRARYFITARLSRVPGMRTAMQSSAAHVVALTPEGLG